MISEPEPTEVMPTTRPPRMPDEQRRAPGGPRWSRPGSRRPRRPRPAAAAAGPCAGPAAPWRSSMPAANRSAMPRLVLTTALGLRRRCRSRAAPARRRTPTGPSRCTSHLTRPRLTVPRRRCTAPPTGFITIDATRSLDTAASGWMPNSRIIIGVIRAPPPMPVRPTTKPTNSPAMATAHQLGSMRRRA